MSPKQSYTQVDIDITSIDTNKHRATFPTTSTSLHRIARAPTYRGIIVGLLLQELNLPQFLQHLYQHPLFATHTALDVDEGSRINIWSTLRIKIPPSTFYRTEQLIRIYAQPGIRGEEARCDPVFYVPTQTAGVRIPKLETLHGRVP